MRFQWGAAGRRARVAIVGLGHAAPKRSHHGRVHEAGKHHRCGRATTRLTAWDFFCDLCVYNLVLCNEFLVIFTLDSIYSSLPLSLLVLGPTLARRAGRADTTRLSAVCVALSCMGKGASTMRWHDTTNLSCLFVLCQIVSCLVVLVRVMLDNPVGHP
jgi:hypothetical protein